MNLNVSPELKFGIFTFFSLDIHLTPGKAWKCYFGYKAAMRGQLSMSFHGKGSRQSHYMEAPMKGAWE